jgi:hypothetical protein
MKALLKFNDGSVKITRVNSSEDAQGDVYVRGRIAAKNPAGGFSEMSFSRVIESGKGFVAEYRELVAESLQKPA